MDKEELAKKIVIMNMAEIAAEEDARIARMTGPAGADPVVRDALGMAEGALSMLSSLAGVCDEPHIGSIAWRLADAIDLLEHGRRVPGKSRLPRSLRPFVG